MRRGLVVIAIGVVLFTVAAIAGFGAAARLAPERLRAEVQRRLSETAGTPISLGTVALRLRQGLVLEIGDLAAGEAEAPVRVRARRAEARIDLMALVLGHLRVERLRLEDADIAIVGGPGASPAPDADAALAPLRTVGERAAARGSPRRLEIEGARVRWTAADGTPRLALDGVDATLQRALLRPRSQLHLEGRVSGSHPGGRLEISGSTAPGTMRLSVGVEELDARALAEALGRTGDAVVEGRLTGGVDGAWRDGRDPRFDVDLRGAGLGARIDRDGAPPLLLAGRDLSLRAEVRVAPDAIHVARATLSDGAIPVRVEATLGRPLGPEAHLEVALSLADLDLPRAAAAVAAWSPPSAGPWLGAFEAGRLERLALHGSARLGEWREVLERDPLVHPGALTLRLELRDAALRVGAGDRIEALSGALELDGHRARLIGLTGRFGSRELPVLDGELRGLANVRGADELRCVAPPPVTSLSGLEALVAWIRSRREEPEADTWQRLRLEADWIAHPTLLCHLEQVVAELRPATGGLDLEIERGVWAGLALHGTARYREAGAPSGSVRDHVAFSAEVGPPFEAMAPHAPRDPWARGRFEVRATRLGRWHIRGARGRFAVSGGTLRLGHGVLALDPEGEVPARVELSLDDPEHLPFRASARAEGIDIGSFALAAGLDRHLLSGHLHGSAAVAGELLPGLPPLAAATGWIAAHGRDGRVHQEIPPLLAVVMASGRLNPFRSDRTLPYEAIDLVARVEGGRVRSEVANLFGPTVRMVADGSLGAVEPHDLEAVLGVFFFPGLDSLIEHVPLLNRVILGANGNLVGAYYALTGAWDGPDARIIPIKSLAAGPASFVLEDIPSFVWGGIKRIQAVLSPAPTTTTARTGRVDS